MPDSPRKPGPKAPLNFSPELEKKVQLMKNISFFKDFTEPELFETAQLSSWLKFSTDDTIVREGDRGSSFWILLKGSVRVVKTILDGKIIQRTLTVIPQGECFGEMSMISGETRTADIVANEEVFLYKIEGYVISQAKDSLQLKFYKRFSEILVTRLARSSQMLAEQS